MSLFAAAPPRLTRLEPALWAEVIVVFYALLVCFIRVARHADETDEQRIENNDNLGPERRLQAREARRRGGEEAHRNGGRSGRAFFLERGENDLRLADHVIAQQIAKERLLDSHRAR